jgi:hypothetical protein
MAYEMKEGDFAIFKNEKCEGKQPQYTGKGMLEGKKVKGGFWVRETKDGKKYFSGKIEIDNY